MANGDTPQTLPPDFFSKTQDAQGSAPATLPPDFFSKQQAAPQKTAAPTVNRSNFWQNISPVIPGQVLPVPKNAEEVAGRQKAVAEYGPAAGSAIGAAVAPESLPLRMLLSTMGGAGGEMVRQKMQGKPLDVKQAGKTGVEYGAVPEVAGAAAGKVVEFAGGLTKDLISRMMGVGAKDVIYGKDPARAILKYKLTASSPAELLEEVEKAKSGVGKQIEQKVAQAPLGPQTPGLVQSGQQASSSGHDIGKALSDPVRRAEQGVLHSTMTPEQKQAAVKELHGLTESLLYTHELDAQGNVILGPMRTFAGNMGKATPQEMLELKRLVGDNVNWQSSQFPGLMKSVQQSIYSNLRKELEGAVPGVKGLNQDYADLAGASQALKRTANKETAGKMSGVGYRDVVAGGLGEIFGGTPGAAAAVAAKRGLESTAGSTNLGKLIQFLANSGASQAVPSAIRATAAVPSTGP